MKVSTLNLITFPENCKNISFYASYQNKARNLKTHWHDFYEIHLIPDGTFLEQINGHQIEMGPRWLFFLKPYDVHEYKNVEPAYLYKLHFTIDIFDTDIQQTLICENFSLITELSEQDYQVIELMCKKIVKEFDDQKPNYMKLIRHLMNCLAIELIRLSNKQYQTTSSSDSLVLALDYIHHHYTENITMQQVADHVGLSPNYFCSKFHKEIGQSFKQYLRGLQLNHAATLLKVTDMSVSNISLESGINSFAHFLRDFKLYYGMTPTQYRKKSK